MNRGIIVVCAVALSLFLACGCSNERDYYVPPVSVETQVVADAVEGFPYSFQLAAYGGAGDSYEWLLIDGTLPQGTTLLATGIISGTPLLTSTRNGYHRSWRK